MSLLHDGRQQLPALYSPVDQQLGLLPPCVHGLALQDHDNDEVSILLEATGQTSPSCLRDTGFDACEAINAEQAVRVDPVVRVIVLLIHRFKLLFLLLRALLVLVVVTIRAAGARDICRGGCLFILLGFA